MSTESILFVLTIIATLYFCAKIIRLVSSTPTKWKNNNREIAINMLVEDIKKAKKRILIFGGKGEIYNKSDILEALSEKETPIKMVLQNENIGTTKLSDLAKKKGNISALLFI